MHEKSYPERPESRDYGNGSQRMDRSVADLLKGIVENVQELIRSEVKLARAEIREEASKAGAAGRSFGLAAILGLYAGGFVLFTIYLVLSLFLASWMAAFAVAVVIGIVAAVMYSSGMKLWKQVSAKPEKTIESVKENVAWLKNQTR
jgi:Flp pilus assembly protein TadB